MTLAGKRGIITVAVLFVCLALIGSFLFIFAGAGHSCTHDDDCEICRMIDMCVHTIRCAAVVFTAALCIFAAVILAYRIFECVLSARSFTLITLKTELRN